MSRSTPNLPEPTCPVCGYKNTEVTGMNTDESPSPGSLSMCCQCYAVSEFGKDLKLREMSKDELMALDTRTISILVRMATEIAAYKQAKATRN